MERTHLLTSFQDFGLADPISRALKEENYLTPTPIQAQTIPLALDRPRRRRHRPDRHRQDRGLRASDPASPAGEPHQAAAQGLPRAGAQPDPRTVGPDPRQLQRLWPPHAADLGAGDRRRADGTPGPLGHAGRRSHGSHARPPARSRAKQRPEARTGRISRARRSRPHARHGLHQRHPQNRRQTADQAADAVLLGDHAEGHRRARRSRCCAIRRASR